MVYSYNMYISIYTFDYSLHFTNIQSESVEFHFEWVSVVQPDTSFQLTIRYLERNLNQWNMQIISFSHIMANAIWSKALWIWNWKLIWLKVLLFRFVCILILPMEPVPSANHRTSHVIGIWKTDQKKLDVIVLSYQIIWIHCGIKSPIVT